MPDWISRRTLLALATLAIVGAGMVIAFSNLLVTHRSAPYLYDNIQNLPANRVGIVLGTSRYTSEGNPNGLYRRRLEAVASLVKAGKIRYVLVSGDNGTPWYDEPTRMRRDLIAMGVAPEIIYRDYAGFRTLDSIAASPGCFWTGFLYSYLPAFSQ